MAITDTFNDNAFPIPKWLYEYFTIEVDIHINFNCKIRTYVHVVKLFNV